MHVSSDRLPTSVLLQRTVGESHRYWAERSTDREVMHAALHDIRSLLLRLQQSPCCVFTAERLSRELCAYEDRLEHIGCPYVEADEREGPEILIAAGFALQKLGVIHEDERVRIATVVMESRATLQECQEAVVERKEVVRQEILRRIAAFLQENV
ncbi:hypothetical protein HYS30_02930 [Candidatus Peregrinibacteria bacterium]|nr:hypothetical protein [Candidatus Peregrinibacteria bacterium]MBI2523753.1 hypothetical protein [Candidatus Peregrinibacteria bacterium]